MKVQVPTTSHIPNIHVVDPLRNRQNVDVQTKIKEVCVNRIKSILSMIQIVIVILTFLEE